VSTPAIEVEAVSKRYQLGAVHAYGGNLSQRLEAAIRGPLRRLRGKPASGTRDGAEEFWALRDVSLDVQPGEVLGLIGANGAGKSTLLKLLSQITVPTEGRILLRGRVGSLLEVGTGFHPELTGRENTFLNGAILGMRRREIKDRFDEIVEFSGIEQFIDTPVKRYSSGMFVRLAFAVAAHLEPQILLVDEVLAVGDAEFQRKCIGKMEDVSQKHGRTIVFVSHNMSSVRRLCDRTVLLEKGRVTFDGPASEGVTTYLERIEPIQHGGVSEIAPAIPRQGTGEAQIVRVSLLDSTGQPTGRLRFGEPFTVSLTVRVDTPVPRAAALIGVSTIDGTRVLTTHSTDRGAPGFALEPGTIEITATLEETLLPGEFVLDVGLMDVGGATIDYLERTLSLTATNIPREGSDDHYQMATVRGFIRPTAGWECGAPSFAGERPAGALR
jgi:lipopolysaccharide transport system ATP-binding protein